ncbi:MAG: hypothetical protein L0241_12710 [Planctomycetia bacterium]|nr:hypothetical protein [Planctomycetia bacterium]
MICIHKPTIPDVLLTKGTPARQKHCDDYDASPDDYRSGAKKFQFDDSIYAATEVKDELRERQHKKCAFCESFFAHTGYGDIEHFRPKGAYQQRETDSLKYPGYYWLAYEWSNLFYSCQLCNQQYKRNLFPLRDGRSRARSHRHNIANEQPLLVDPGGQEPSDYIEFRDEIAFPVKGCREGIITIEVLGLNREELVDIRGERLNRLRDLVLLRDLLREKVATIPTPEYSQRLRDVEATLQASKDDTAEYAAMARAVLV